MSTKKIELIAQLLAKAESTTPAEAEALTEHAERLMVKYMIDQAVIDEHRANGGQESEKIVEHRMDFRGAYRGEILNLGIQVVNSLGGLRAMQFTGGSGKVFSLWVIGFESDVKQAEILINSLQVQAMVAMRAWWAERRWSYEGVSSYNQEKARRTFVHGFGTGAGVRIRGSRQQAVQEAGSGTELVLVGRQAKVNEYMAGKSTRKARVRNATASGSAHGHGIMAGMQANTGDKAVSQGRGISA